MTEEMSSALITSVIINIFHVVWLANITLEPKYNRKKTVIILAATGVLVQILGMGMGYIGILGGMFSYAGYSLATVIYGAAYIFGVSISPSKSVFLLSAYYCLWTFIHSVISLFTDAFAGAGEGAIWLLRIGLNLFFLLLYHFFFKKRFFLLYHEIRHGDRSITVLSLLTFYMVTLLVFSNEKQHSHSAFYFYMLISVYIFVVSVYVVLFRFMGRLNDEWQLKQMQLHEKLLLAQIDSYDEIERNARQTRHDFRHHIIVVVEFAKNRDYQGILDYLQNYDKEETEKYARTFCANHAVNHVLSVYLAKAEKKEIEIKTDIRLWDTSGISDVDFVSILANILENAISGCMQAEGKRRIEISVRQREKKYTCVCKNTCTSNILFENGIPKNKSRDSVGVESILRIARKYAGNVDFSAESGIFTCRVVLGNCLG